MKKNINLINDVMNEVPRKYNDRRNYHFNLVC